MRQGKKILLGLISIVALLVLGGVVIILMSEWKLSKLVPGGLGERFPTKVYSSPFTVSEGAYFSPEEILERLRRLGYQTSAIRPVPLGSFEWNPPTLTIGLRGFQTPLIQQEPKIVSLTRETNGSWRMGRPQSPFAESFHIEPELVAELSGPQKVRRDPTTWEEIPPLLIDAVVAVEDRRFYKHQGVDFRAIARATLFNIRHRKYLQGGSTLTQQLAKNFFLSQERTLRRKLVEFGFAIYLDLRYSKERILTMYLNHIYLGQDGAVSIAGVKAAAHHYFGKTLPELNIGETALLAGLIRSPFRYNPHQNPASAKKRRNTVLKVMLNENVLSKEDYERGVAEPLVVIKQKAASSTSNRTSDYFVAEVIRQLVPHFDEDTIFCFGLRIYTTMDPLRQEIAQETVRTESQQSAIVVMNPANGRVEALVGGKNFQDSAFNRATQARRQAGSAFKPFVYGAALERGFTPATILKDEPRAYKNDGKIWAPKNFNNSFRGSVSIREALAHSINGATLDLAQRLTPAPILTFARKMGIETPLENSLMMALGISEVSPLELTAAYAPFANGGFRVTPLFVTAVVDYEGHPLEINNVERETVLDPTLAYLMTSLLGTTITEGTALDLKKGGWERPSAGKTGTTNQGRDAWFIGYTPDLLTGVWVGNDENKPVQLSGSRNALPLWTNFMKRALEGRKAAPFEKPTGLTQADIDPLTGDLARSGCPLVKSEMFVKGTEPKAQCSLHRGGFRGWLMKIFRGKQ